jgi:hypothetical protein
MGRWPGVLVEAASSGGTGTSCWRLASGSIPPAAGIARLRPGSPACGQDGVAAGSPTLAFSGHVTPKMRPQDRDDTDGDLCPQLRQRPA